MEIKSCDVAIRMYAYIYEKFKKKIIIGFGPGISPAPASPTRRPLSPDHPNPALPITETPSPAMGRMGWALRTLLVSDSSSCLKDRKVIKTCI